MKEGDVVINVLIDFFTHGHKQLKVATWKKLSTEYLAYLNNDKGLRNFPAYAKKMRDIREGLAVVSSK